jgi:pimeloyl-ACP methyl ester carboxylesterase
MMGTQNKRKSFGFIVYKLLDAFIFMCAEYTKTFIRECILILSQILNLFIKLLLHLVYKPGHYEMNVSHRPRKLYDGGEGGAHSTPLFSNLRKKKEKRTFVSQKDALLHPSENNQPLSGSKSRDLLEENGSTFANGSMGNKKHSAPALMDFISKTPFKYKWKQQASIRSNNNNDNSINYNHKEGDRLNRILEQVIYLNTTSNDRRKISSTSKTPQITEGIENQHKKELESEEDMLLVEDDLSTTDSMEDQDEISVGTDRSIIGKIYSRILSAVLWFIMLIWYIPSLFKPPSLKTHSEVRNDKVHLYEKKSTGLIQDFTLALFEFTDAIAQAVRLAIRFEWSKCWSQIKFSFSLFQPSVFLSDEGIDDRSVEQVIIDEGFPHESVTCETQDGYVLHMDRIPNKKARKVVYFQHGVLDSAFAWVGNGVSHSLAFRAYSLNDVDVFLGNFRGYGLSPHYLETTEAFNKKNYWDYSINEHAFYDIRAFVEKITEIKKKELNCDEDEFSIIAVAHSLGAGAVLAYLVHSKLTNQKHHLSRAILMAPSGIHQKIPLLANIMTYTFLPVARRIIPYFGLTTRTKKILFAKLSQDISNHPALRALFAVAFSKLLLGGPVEDSPFQYVHNLIYQSYNGTSIKVVDHLIQMKRSGKFQAYDYGSAKENMKHYGQEKPWNFLEYYKDIEPMIPIHILYGDDDRIIPAHNILMHAKELQKWHGKKYVYVKKFRHCGHLELTLGMNVKVIKYILQQIQS